MVRLEQWKVAADHLTQGLARREEFARFYLSLNVALITVGAAVADSVDADRLLLLPIVGAGLIACLIWWAQDRVLTDSLHRRQEVVEELEKGLPHQPFTATSASGDFASRASRARRGLPLVFGSLLLIIGVVILVAALV